QRLAEVLVFDPVELELKEDQPGGEVVKLLVDVAVEFLAGGIGGVADIMEGGIGTDAPEKGGQRLVFGDGGGQLTARQAGQPTTPLAGKILGVAVGAVEVLAQQRGFGGRIEIGEIPFGKSAELGGGGLSLCGGSGHEALGGGPRVVP